MEIVVHGHFYQPPREDPWTGRVPLEESAAPFRDWNARIAAECYRPNAFARIFDHGRILSMANNYRLLSFDLGPTLAGWLEHGDETTLSRIVAGDRAARRAHDGAGNAVAHPWVHAILPLCDPLDRSTLIAWGLADFRHRFGRAPRGLWLPETAADNATLADLVDHGLAFTILAPRQARRIRRISAQGRAEGPWQEVDEAHLDTSQPYRFCHPDGSGRGLAVFFFDGPLSHAVAFGPALRSTAAFVEAVEAAARRAPGGLLHLAVDGESMGHHQNWGERVLAHALSDELPRRGVRVTNYEDILARRPEEAAWMQVDLDLGPDGEGSAWSCAHGLGRWARDCGCRVNAHTTQAWRDPLRRGLDRLRDRGREFYREAMSEWTADVWGARDGYVATLLDPSPASRSRFLRRRLAIDLHEDERSRAFCLLELQRHALTMYTSCGWFFDDFAGLETLLVLRHAARVLDLWDEVEGGAPRDEFEAILAEVRTVRGQQGNGADVFRRLARPAARFVAPQWRARPLVGALRRWLAPSPANGSAADASADSGSSVATQGVLAAIAEGDLAGDAPPWVDEKEQAQEILWSACFEPAAPEATENGTTGASRLPGAAEIAEALGFAANTVRGHAPVLALGPAGERVGAGAEELR